MISNQLCKRVLCCAFVRQATRYLVGCEILCAIMAAVANVLWHLMVWSDVSKFGEDVKFNTAE